MGASVTASGRQITTFMMETIAAFIDAADSGKITKTVSREKDGSIRNTYACSSATIIYGDTDSVDGESMVRTDAGEMTIEDLFDRGTAKITHEGREFSHVDLKSWTSDGHKSYLKPIKMVYRHKVKKARWKITDATGKSVIVTNDHSVMVMRNGVLTEVKPSEMDRAVDLLVVNPMEAETCQIGTIEQLDDFDDEYVYDIVMEDSSMPYFFANDILVHNSCYFHTHADNKADAVRIADAAAEDVNSKFPAFMRDVFFCNTGFDELIQAGREVVGSAALFLPAKKKYTIKVVNLDGFDLEAPKLKTMGSEMKKADTPKVIQNFLKDLMDQVLDDAPYAQLEKFVNSQRGKLIRGVKNPISLGVAKQINNLDAKYAEWTRVEKAGKGKVALPGHVRAAVNYNEMAQKFAGKAATLLKAGDKGMVFYLGPNDFGIATIAFPADTVSFPQWFVDNFKLNRKLTEEKMIDAKIQRIFETMNWDVPTPHRTMVKSILKF